MMSHSKIDAISDIEKQAANIMQIMIELAQRKPSKYKKVNIRRIGGLLYLYTELRRLALHRRLIIQTPERPQGEITQGGFVVRENGKEIIVRNNLTKS